MHPGRQAERVHSRWVRRRARARTGRRVEELVEVVTATGTTTAIVNEYDGADSRDVGRLFETVSDGPFRHPPGDDPKRIRH